MAIKHTIYTSPGFPQDSERRQLGIDYDGDLVFEGGGLSVPSLGARYSPLSYGAAGDGSTDDSAAVQAAVDAASIGGGVVVLGASHAIASTIAVSASNVELRGLGADDNHDVGSLGANAGTVLKWTGASGGEMVRFTSTSGAGNQKERGGGCRGIYFDANGLAGKGLTISSWNSGVFEDLHFEEFSDYGLGLTCVATLGEARDTQKNIFRRIGARQLLSDTSEAIRLATDDTGANPSMNLFEDIDLSIKNGDGFGLRNCDNNVFLRTRAIRASGGSGSGIKFHGANDGGYARSNVFLHYSNSAITHVGTETYTNPPIDNCTLLLDKDNGTPEPTFGTGAIGSYSFTNGVDVFTASARKAFAPTQALAILAQAEIKSTANLAAWFVRAFELSNSEFSGSIVFRWEGTDPEIALREGGAGTMLSLFRGLKIDGTQVLSTQQAAIADATDAPSAITQLNLALAAMRAHGLIAT